MARSKKTAVQNKPSKKMGRPFSPDITPATLNKIFSTLEEGESFRYACEKEGVDRMTALNRINGNEELVSQYTRSKKLGLEYKIDTIYEAIKNEPDVARVKLLVDTLKWHISKVLPKKYGEQIQLNADIKADVKNTISADFVAMFLKKFGGDDAQN